MPDSGSPASSTNRAGTRIGSAAVGATAPKMSGQIPAKKRLRRILIISTTTNHLAQGKIRKMERTHQSPVTHSLLYVQE
jgi:hypothetical protein